MKTLTDQEPLLVLGLTSDIATDVIAPLIAAGYHVKLGNTADLPRRQWRLVLSAPNMPGQGSLELLAALREGQNPPPKLLLVGPAELLPKNVEDEADAQCFAWPFEPQQLITRVQQMLRDKPTATWPSSAPMLQVVVATPMTNEDEFLEMAKTEREALRAGRSPGDSFVVSLRLDELDQFRLRLGTQAEAGVWRQVAELTGLDALAGEKLGQGQAGDLLILLPNISQKQAGLRLKSLISRMANHRFVMGVQTSRFSPVIGFSGLRNSSSVNEILDKAREAAKQSAQHLDLHPALWKRSKVKPLIKPGVLRLWWSDIYAVYTLLFQYLITLVVGLVLPFFIYWALGTHGYDISGGVYIFIVMTLALTAAAIWIESALALKRIDPPTEPASPYPPASAIIAAYLPNEAAIIEDTINAFLQVQYPASLQIILAYNTPKDMPEVEERLREIARLNPRFIPIRVFTSTSKAQNINAALPYVTGKFTAVFDADHQPDPDSFRRGWRWISHGADVVQGHCFIRNGAASWVAKIVAVEFEQIYAVSHPGRARLHGFGIFGGSNGYWRTALLRETRMHGFMLTEDIDSSMRALVRGQRIISDPYLISRELAPETLVALTKQRLRWSQGWLQISMKWLLPALRSRELTLRQKFGILQLLGTREVYPWISMQILPIIAWWVVRAGSLSDIEWLVPIFVVTSLFTLGTGPGQIIFTYILSDPKLKQKKTWFWFYLLTSALFYAGLKNAWVRIAHYKELRGETSWVVTPRAPVKK